MQKYLELRFRDSALVLTSTPAGVITTLSDRMHAAVRSIFKYLTLIETDDARITILAPIRRAILGKGTNQVRVGDEKSALVSAACHPLFEVKVLNLIFDFAFPRTTLTRANIFTHFLLSDPGDSDGEAALSFITECHGDMTFTGFERAYLHLCLSNSKLALKSLEPYGFDADLACDSARARAYTLVSHADFFLRWMLRHKRTHTLSDCFISFDRVYVFVWFRNSDCVAHVVARTGAPTFDANAGSRNVDEMDASRYDISLHARFNLCACFLLTFALTG
jgi:hypothetical protein